MKLQASQLNLIRTQLLLKIAVLVFVLSGPAYAVNEIPSSFTLEGELFDSPTSSTHLLDTGTLRIQVLNPAKTCILYDESQLFDTTATNGFFNIQVGSAVGAAKRVVGSDPGNSMLTVYQNTTPINCAGGGAYTPNPGDARYIRTIVTPTTTAVVNTMSPDMLLGSVPTALVAERAESLQGYIPSQLLFAGNNLAELTATSATARANLGLGSVSTINTSGNAAQVLLGNGTFGTVPTPAGFSGVLAGDVSGAQGATSVDKIKGKGVATGAYAVGQTLRYDGTNWVNTPLDFADLTGVAILSQLPIVDVVHGGTGSNTASGARTNLGLGTAATLNVGTGANNIVQLDGSAKLPAVDGSSLTNLNGSSINTGTIGGSTVINTSGNITTTGTVTAGTVTSTTGSTNNLRVYKAGNANYVLLTAPAGLAANYSLNLPAADGTNGQILYTNGAGGLGWTSITTSLGFTPLNPANNLSDVASAATSRTNLGLGTAAVQNIGSGAGNVIQLDVLGKLPPVDGSQLTGLAYSQISGTPTSLPPSGAAGGDLLGSTYPNPVIANNAITTAKVFANPGINRLVATNSTTGTTLAPITCAGGELLTWNAGTGWTCTAQSSLAAGSSATAVSATNFTGSLVGDVTGTQGATTVATVGGATAANVATATTAANAATNANTVSTIVKRDASGNFSAGTITATLSGNATTATSAGSFTGSLVGDVTGTQGATTVATVGTSTAANIHAAELLANAATNANTVSTIVKRDASGNFTAGTITAALSGNATTATSAGSFTGSLVGDVTGTQGATVVSTVGGATAANVATATTAANAATNANTVSTIVKRDASGNFSAGTITAALSGNATTATSAGSFTGSLVGDVTGTQGATTVATVGTSTAANIHAAELLANAATNANTVSTIVKRDASGNFSAGTITAALSGNATTATSAGSFTGSLVGDVTGTQGATSVAKLQGTTLTISAPASGQVLTYNGAAFVNQALPAAPVTSVSVTAPITNVGTASAPNISITQSSGTTNGYLSSADWTTFNSKQAAGSYITALTGDVTAAGPGSAAATIAAGAVGYSKLNTTAFANNTGLLVTDGTSVNQKSCASGELLTWNVTTGWTCTASTSLAVTAMTSLNGLNGPAQTFATPGTAGTAPAWSSAGTAHTLNIPMASTGGVTAGLVSNTEFGNLLDKASTQTVTGVKTFGNVTQSANTFLKLSINDAATDGNYAPNYVAGYQGAIYYSQTQGRMAVVDGLGSKVHYVIYDSDLNNAITAASASAGVAYILRTEIPTCAPGQTVLHTVGPPETWTCTNVVISNATNLPAPAGDIGGTYGAMQVNKIQNVLVNGTAVLGGVFAYDNATSTWKGKAFPACTTAQTPYYDSIGDTIACQAITASWAGITGKPTTVAGYGITDAGTVTSVTSANADIAVATGTSTPVLTLNSGTTANKILKLDASARIPAVDGSLITGLTYAQLSGGTVGGDLTGSLPNPTLAASGVTANTYGSSTSVPVITVDAKGRITSASSSAIPTSNGTTLGLLSAADWTAFNSKQAAGSYITALTGDVTASGPGSAAATIAAGAVGYSKLNTLGLATNTGLLVTNGTNIDLLPCSVGQVLSWVGGTGWGCSNQSALTVGSATNFTGSLVGDVTGTQGATVVSTVGTSTAANVHAAELLANAATNANTVSTIVKRDASGNFSAGTITAALNGNAATATSAGSFTGSLVGDVTGTQGATVVSTVGTSTAANVHAAELLANAATNANTVSTIVKRDASGNFSAGTITAALSGNATTATSAGSFTGSLVGDVTGTQGATVVSTVGGATAANVATATTAANAATNANTVSTIVKRDASGNFSAGTITATLNGSATSATSFSGSLVGDVTGTQGATVVSTVGGATAANVATATTAANAATNANTVSTIVKRDASGNFSAGTITATLNGNASTATTATNFSGSLVGDVTGTQGATVVSTVGGATAANVATATTAANAATNLNTVSTIVKRDASGNFTAGTITATLNGNAATATSATSFSGSLVGDVTGTQGATVVSTVGGATAANVATATTAANAATNLNTASTIVKRDASGNFTAGTITATLNGTATSAANFTGSLVGDVTGTQGATVVGKINGVALSGLATGILKNTTTTGVPSIAVAADFPILNQNTTGTAANVTGTVAVANGGTGLTTTPTNGQLLIGNGTNYTLAAITGTANQVNVTNGAGSITLSTPQSIASTSSPTFAGLTITGLSGVVSASAGVLSAGTLSVANGGTGLTGGTTYGIPYFSGPTTLTSSSALNASGVLYSDGITRAPSSTASGTANQVLISGGAGGAPSWSTITLSNGDTLGAVGALTVQSAAGFATTLGNSGTTSSTTVQSGTGGIALSSSATGASAIALTANSSSNAAGISLSATAAGGGVTIAAGTGNVNITSGNLVMPAASTISSVTGNITLESASGSTSIIGNTGGASATTIQSGTGNISLTSTGTTASAIGLTVSGVNGGITFTPNGTGGVFLGGATGSNFNVGGGILTGPSAGSLTVQSVSNQNLVVKSQGSGTLTVGSAATGNSTIGNSGAGSVTAVQGGTGAGGVTIGQSGATGLTTITGIRACQKNPIGSVNGPGAIAVACSGVTASSICTCNTDCGTGAGTGCRTYAVTPGAGTVTVTVTNVANGDKINCICVN